MNLILIRHGKRKKRREVPKIEKPSRWSLDERGAAVFSKIWTYADILKLHNFHIFAINMDSTESVSFCFERKFSLPFLDQKREARALKSEVKARLLPRISINNSQ